MVYEFQDQETGEIIGLNFPMIDCPEIGSTVQQNGRGYTRIFSFGMEVGVPCDGNSYPKVSKTLPQFAPGADFVQDPGRDYGCPIIESRAQQDELCKRHGYTRDYHHTDTDHSQDTRAKNLRHALDHPTFGKA